MPFDDDNSRVAAVADPSRYGGGGRAQGTGSKSFFSAPTVLSQMRLVAAVVALALCVHAGLWALLRERTTAPDFDGQLASVSYAPYANSGSPEAGYRPTAAQIRADRSIIPKATSSSQR